MKKQFLSISFFLLTAVAGMNVANAQSTKAVKWSNPIPITGCDDDALHPRAGKEYTYVAEADDTSDLSGQGKWRFWATNDPNFITVDSDGNPVFNYENNGALGVDITNLDELLDASSNYNQLSPAVGATNEGSVNISWTSTLLNKVIASASGFENLFVVAYYENASGCTDNVSVWELDPKNSFTVDVIAMDIDAPANSKDIWNATPETCVDRVKGLKYENGGLVYDYGYNYLYFEFIAANFTGYWIPEFTIGTAGGMNTVQADTYEYTYDTPDTWDDNTVWSTLVTGTTHIESEDIFTNEGVSVFVRATIKHNNYENLSGQTLTLTLDGKVDDGNGGFVYDIVNADCSNPGKDGADKASATITARPEKKDPKMPGTPAFINGNEAN